MSSFDRALPLGSALLLAALALPRSAMAQQPPQAQGFAVERLYTSAPGAGWIVMDDVDEQGGLGGAMAFVSGYSHNPLAIGSPSLPVVRHQGFSDVAFAVTFDRFRLSLDFPVPWLVEGQGGIAGGYQFAAPAPPNPSSAVDLGSAPDIIYDARVGIDARILGEPGAPFRLGAGAQLYIPSGLTSEYITDGTYRAMFRALVAGDVGLFTYAAQLGVHVRPLDTSPQPDSPRGSELLFGVAAGARVPLERGALDFVVGPEVFGASAFSALFGGDTTSLEALLSARLEGTATSGPQLRAKLGAGLGIVDSLGAPEWRAVAGIEIFDHSGDRDHDGVPDAQDACPEQRGERTSDPKTSGCPKR
jgi:hypothetical protein